jgi:REP element-mobilizing transposase RayT
MANRPQRLRGFSYVGQHRYFLTICVRQRAPVFKIDSVSRFVIAQFLLCATAHGFELLAYCAMPDHFHALAIGLTDTSNLLPLIHAFKRDTSFWWKRQGPNGLLWQEGFHDQCFASTTSTKQWSGTS